MTIAARPRAALRHLFAALASVAWVAGCGSPSATPAQDAGVLDGGAGGSLDAGDAAADASGAIDAGVPTPTPLVEYLGGPILSAPKIVTVTFPNDDAALVARLQQFDDTITSTSWWTQVGHEYCATGGAPCVGPGSGAGHVVLGSPAASSYTDSIRGGDSTVRQLLATSVESGALPAPDAQTLYVVYFPAGTIVLLDGISSCSTAGFAGYHDTMTAPSGEGGAPTSITYAVVARCSNTEAAATLAASHELIEAATDPSPETAPGFQMTDPVWTAFGPDVADVCAAVDSNLAAQAGGFAVQRSWSNASASAGHDPCVPVQGAVYFNVAPAMGLERVSLSVGQSATIPLFAFADGPTSPWQISAITTNGSSAVALSLSQGTAAPGAPLLLTVTLQSTPSFGPDLLYGLVSQSAGDAHVWPMLVHAR